MIDVSKFKIEVSINDEWQDNLKESVERSQRLNELFCALCDTNFSGKTNDVILEVIRETDKKIIKQLKSCVDSEGVEFKLLEKGSKKK